MPTATTPATKPPRVTKRRAETRARLVEAAFRVFSGKGYGHVTIEDVCLAAGYTRGAFYSQFENLEELFFLLYDQWAARTAEQVSTAMQHSTELRGVVERVVDTLFFERDWLLIKFDFLLHAARHPKVAHRWDAHRAQLRNVIEERLVAAGIASHESADTARAVIVAYDGVSAQLLLDGDEASARARLSQVLNAVLTQ
ncbi:TetR/AcrR family transcriptional regulator [Mycobacterium vicinigordonae]|uniref:TetR/AcrR family transcriptional regulator n=1 Tax=Mycobacterium vicinigordonae TaxID=1719132 RepID=A0A7D6HNV6_9MYCO|nr:TetR/AcrR family transcriptional regulator [Mycobacterium vicinigordonae]QLL06691.1 TetR/AcrR family transcriptional regulator [Mycobacterium vicinigordonae]